MARLPYRKSVFINCPLDDQYSRFLDALTFTIQDCGFIARCALPRTVSSDRHIVGREPVWIAPRKMPSSRGMLNRGSPYGDAYLFLILVLVAALAGLLLVANSLFHVARQRTWRSAGIGLLFVLVGAIGGGVAWHFLPQFRMH